MLLKLDFESDTPIYRQIRNQIVLGIAGGDLLPGEKLPTIRALADEAGVNMMTVNKAYQLLKQEGFIVTDRRNGAAVKGSRHSGGLDETARGELRLIISQAKLVGMNKDELLTLCSKLYDGEEDSI